MKRASYSNLILVASLTATVGLSAAGFGPQQQQEKQQQQQSKTRGTVGLTCDGSSTDTTYALLQVSGVGSGVLGASTNNDPIAGSNDTGTQVDYAPTPPTITLNTSNGAHYCNSYYNGSSWVTDTNYASQVIDVAYFLLADNSNTVASRFPTTFAEVIPSGTSINPPGSWWNTVLQEYNLSTDTYNTYTCTDANGSYYWKVLLCNN